MVILRVFSLLYGVFFLLLGIIGFILFSPVNDKLFNFFEVSFILNLMHLLVGIFALLVTPSIFFTKIYFKIFGVIFGLFTLLGFTLDGDLFFAHINMPDNFLYLITSIIALFIAFFI